MPEASLPVVVSRAIGVVEPSRMAPLLPVAESRAMPAPRPVPCSGGFVAVDSLGFFMASALGLSFIIVPLPVVFGLVIGGFAVGVDSLRLAGAPEVCAYATPAVASTATVIKVFENVFMEFSVVG